MRNILGNRFLSQFLLILIVIGFASHTISAADYYQDQELVENSKQKINEAFINLCIAQTAGSNITPQLNKLITISEYLYNVKYLKQDEVTDDKILEIETKISELYQLYDETQDIRKTAIQEQINLKNNLLLVTFIEIIIFISFIYGIYRYVEGHDDEGILRYKPELNSNE